MLPSELTVASTPRSTFPASSPVPSLTPDLTKIMAKHRRNDPSPDDKVLMTAQSGGGNQAMPCS